MTDGEMLADLLIVFAADLEDTKRKEGPKYTGLPLREGYYDSGGAERMVSDLRRKAGRE